jgi:hypothetical protein
VPGYYRGYVLYFDWKLYNLRIFYLVLLTQGLTAKSLIISSADELTKEDAERMTMVPIEHYTVSAESLIPVFPMR